MADDELKQRLELIKNATEKTVIQGEPQKTYLAGEETVSASDPFKLNVTKALGREGRWGFIISDTGTIYLQINGSAKIPVKVNETYDLEHHLTELIEITTTSAAALTFRYVVV